MVNTTDNRFPSTTWGLVSKLLVDGLFASLAIILITIVAARIFSFPPDVFFDGTSTAGATAINAFVGIAFLGGALALIALGYLTGPFKLVFHIAAILVIAITAIGSLSAGFDRQTDSLGVPTEMADLVTGFSAMSAAICATFVWKRARQFRAGFPDADDTAPPQDEVREVNTDLPPFPPTLSDDN